MLIPSKYNLLLLECLRRYKVRFKLYANDDQEK